MRIYLANKMRGMPLYNWPWFEAAAKVLRAKGHEVVNPTEIDEALGVVFVEFDTDHAITDVRLTEKYDFASVIGRDLAVVLSCDGIVLGPDWASSQGARMERCVAIDNGLAVFDGVESVPDILVTHTETPSDFDYPILCAEDELRHEQRWESALLAEDEVRVVDPETGGAKGTKLARFDLLPPDAMWAVAEQYGRGSLKYEDRNWEKSYSWSLSFAAMMRHAWQFWGGEDIDADSGSPHMAAVAWHALALLTFYLREIGTDDRAV